MNHIELSKIANSHKTPLYVYDGRIILQNAQNLKDAFKGFSVYYSVKANPHPEVCSALARLGLGAEVVSEGEIKVALAAGFNSGEMLFAGPGKIAGELKFALEAGIRLITAESVGQLELIDRVAREIGCKVRSLLRINVPELRFVEGESMMGAESQFGLDVESFVAAKTRIEALTHTTIVGTQYYAGSQILDPRRLAASVRHQIEATRNLTKNLSVSMQVLDIGGGFGIPYQEREDPLDLGRCAELVRAQVGAAGLEPGVRVIVESGRFLVGPAGVFLTRVVDVKETGGRLYVICDGGMGGFTRPVLVRTPHRLEVLGAGSDSDHKRECVVCGPSCSSLDSFGTVLMRPPEVGDVIAVCDAGAYGWSMSLQSFQCASAPQEVYLTPSWKSRWITPKSEPFRSKIHGFGVKAIAPISKGEVVAVLGGVIVPAEEFEEYERSMGDVGIQINEKFFICPSDRKELERTGIFNHSCNPNLGYKDSITLIAIRSIDVNEELVFDYAFSETQHQAFECNCGSSSCRKRIEPTDWKRSDIQKNYGDFFSPYIKNKREFGADP
jgi:diaminopimelate decarboxylase